MKITLLCNAGLMLEQNGQTLLIDAPNGTCSPFYTLPDIVWEDLMQSHKIVGLYFTHCHPDHYASDKVEPFCALHPDIPVFIPNGDVPEGRITMGEFDLEFCMVPHAPIERPPLHVVTMIQTKDKKLYLAADAELEPAAHRKFLKGRKADIGIWNPMFLSRPETRDLMHEAAYKNYIYHMPLRHDDTMGIWKKCKINFERASEELQDITVLDHYPYPIF